MKNIIKICVSVILTFSIMLLFVVNVAADSNYVENTTTSLSIDVNEYKISKTADYTVYTFTPEEVGLYKFTSENLIGIVGYHWIIEENVNEEIVCNNTIEWECNAVGQGIYVAIKGDGNSKTAIINITREEVEIELPIERTPYENTAEIKPFKYKGNPDNLVFVDVYDDFVDTAVLGEDGYYHLNSVDGPILYMNVYDTELVNLIDSVNYGQLVAAIFEDDKHVATIDYNDAFTAYYEAADADTGLYPLTADLIEIYKSVGFDKVHNWYGEDGWISGSNIEDGWLFSCMYSTTNDEDYVVDDSSSSAEKEEIVIDKNETTTTESTKKDDVKSPVTGDSATALAVTMLSAAAVVFGLKSKK